VLIVTTLKLRHPIGMFIFMKTNDSLLHTSEYVS
jgi:hypothetical protein